MRRTQLSIAALPAWAKLNDVDFLDTCCTDLGGAKGFGIVTLRTLSSKDISDLPTLLIVPQDLILSAGAIEEHLKVDHHFRQLVEIAGGTSLRDSVMLFLLMQITIASPEHKQNVGLSNPWTEYVKMMPASVPVPTMWSEEERCMLAGTSLEAAVNAKMVKLQREFDTLREKTAELPWCLKCWWENDVLQLSDWILLDAWYRSRSLELPKSGEAMVPCFDMANHSSEPIAYWEQIDSNNVSLLLRPGLDLNLGDEIMISYGAEKSAAEFLFSYGFIDEARSNSSLVLAIQPFADDPLGKAKVQAFTQPPTVSISKQEDTVEWKSPFLYFMSLNEEDGLEFRVLQQVDGLRSPLRVFWQEKDVTEDTDKFEAMVSEHPLKEVFQLRVLALLNDRIRQQLERLYESEEMVNIIGRIAGSSRQDCVMLLRNSEIGILEKAFEDVDMRKRELLENETVLRYLGSMEDDVGKARQDEDENETNDEEDFS